MELHGLSGTPGYYTAPAGTLNSLEETSSTTWVETQPDGLQFNYSLVAGDDVGQLMAN